MTTDLPRQYKQTELPPGQIGSVVSEITASGYEAVLWLPPGTPSETKGEIIEAIQRAYRAGWEDRGGCSADVEDTSSADTFRQRALNRAQQAAHDAALAISEGKVEEAGYLLAEAHGEIQRSGPAKLIADTDPR